VVCVVAVHGAPGTGATPGGAVKVSSFFVVVVVVGGSLHPARNTAPPSTAAASKARSLCIISLRMLKFWWLIF
jgi:hypothetical protein